MLLPKLIPQTQKCNNQFFTCPLARLTDRISSFAVATNDMPSVLSGVFLIFS
jgi:hypothetical protein